MLSQIPFILWAKKSNMKSFLKLVGLTAWILGLQGLWEKWKGAFRSV